MIKFHNLKKQLMITQRPSKSTQITLILTIIRALVLIERAIMMKLSNAFPKLYLLSPTRQISIIIEALRTERRESSIMPSKIIRTLF